MKFIDPIDSIIIIQKYCMNAKRITPKIRFYVAVCEMAQDVEYVPTDCDIFTLDDYIRKERNPEVKEALQEISDYLCGY